MSFIDFVVIVSAATVTTLFLRFVAGFSTEACLVGALAGIVGGTVFNLLVFS